MTLQLPIYFSGEYSVLVQWWNKENQTAEPLGCKSHHKEGLVKIKGLSPNARYIFKIYQAVGGKPGNLLMRMEANCKQLGKR